MTWVEALMIVGALCCGAYMGHSIGYQRGRIYQLKREMAAYDAALEGLKREVISKGLT